jgi:hypothetical protein
MAAAASAGVSMAMAAASKYQRMHQAKIMASYNGVNMKAFNESWQWRLMKKTWHLSVISMATCIGNGKMKAAYRKRNQRRNENRNNNINNSNENGEISWHKARRSARMQQPA